MKHYKSINDVPLQLKQEIRDMVYCAVVASAGWLESVHEICTMHSVAIDCPAIQAIIFDQIKLTEYELSKR